MLKPELKAKNIILPLKQLTTEEKKAIDNLYYAGMRYFKQGKLAEAKSKWEQVLRLDPLHVKAKQNIEKLKEVK